MLRGAAILVDTNVGLSGYIAARCGRRADALAEIRRLTREQQAGRYASHYGLAMIYAGLGEKEQAFAELERAFTERAWAMFTLKVDPAFEAMHSDPRFVRLLARLNLGS